MSPDYLTGIPSSSGPSHAHTSIRARKARGQPYIARKATAAGPKGSKFFWAPDAGAEGVVALVYALISAIRGRIRHLRFSGARGACGGARKNGKYFWPGRKF